MASFNHFKIKRQAHALSRHGSSSRYNPFAHFGWRNNRRSQTFPVDAERGLMNGGPAVADDADEEAAPRLTHAISAPPPRGAARDHHRDDEGEKGVDGKGTTGAGSQLPLAPHVAENGGSSKSSRDNGSDSSPEQQQQARSMSSASAADKGEEAGALRNRRQVPMLVTDGIGGTGIEDGDGLGGDGGQDKKPKKESKFLRHVEPKQPFTVANQIQRTFLNSWINVLLVAAPAGIALHFTSVSPIAIFVVNFVAIIPLAAMLSFATEEIALRTGETLGGLLNATFGNAVELIVAIIALIDNQVVIVQTSLIGSILSNLLLVLGMCFFFGGLRRQEQFFNTTVAQTAASLLALAVAGAIVPTVFDKNSTTSALDVAMLSRGTSVILLVVYAAYLFFQLHTHHAVFNEQSQKVPAKPFRSADHHHLSPHANAAKHGIGHGLAGPGRGIIATGISPSTQTGRDELARMLRHPPRRAAFPIGGGDGDGDEDDDDAEDPKLHFLVALALLAGSTVVIAFCAEFLVDSIDYVTKQGGISKEFLGLVLLPIVGNAAEHATAVTVAIKDKMDLAIGVAIGSSMQVALFLIPLLVIIGWGRGMDNMTLSFDVFQVAVLFVAVLLVNYLISDGKSHWLEGFLLICLYCIIAVCSWWYPVNDNGQATGSSSNNT